MKAQERQILVETFGRFAERVNAFNQQHHKGPYTTEEHRGAYLATHDAWREVMKRLRERASAEEWPPCPDDQGLSPMSDEGEDLVLTGIDVKIDRELIWPGKSAGFAVVGFYSACSGQGRVKSADMQNPQCLLGF